MSATSTAVPLRDADRRNETAELGMWVFLATEVLFFGALFFVYAMMRARFSESFGLASRHTDVVFGTLNTAVLLTSSFTMALAVRASDLARARQARYWLLATAVLGIAFLTIKGLEYGQDYAQRLVPGLNFQFEPAHARGAEVFFGLYFATTGLHAVHLTVGIVLVLITAFAASHARPEATSGSRIEVVGLYWHFVDLVWIFLYPLLYLVSRA